MKRAVMEAKIEQRGTAPTFEARVEALRDRAEADLDSKSLGMVIEGATRLVALDVDADESVEPATLELWAAKLEAKLQAAA